MKNHGQWFSWKEVFGQIVSFEISFWRPGKNKDAGFERFDIMMDTILILWYFLMDSILILCYFLGLLALFYISLSTSQCPPSILSIAINFV